MTPSQASASLHYPRANLLALATGQISGNIRAPAPDRLSSVGGPAGLLRRDTVMEWGVDESVSSLLAEEGDAAPLAKRMEPDDTQGRILGLERGDGVAVGFGSGLMEVLKAAAVAPIEVFRLGDDDSAINLVETQAEKDQQGNELLFNFQSMEDKRPPILVNFADPFNAASTKNVTGATTKASAAFQSRNFASTPAPLMRTYRNDSATSDRTLAMKIGGMEGPDVHRPLISRSSSISSSFSTSPVTVLRKGSLNPWAAPFPLPATTPIIPAPAPAAPRCVTADLSWRTDKPAISACKIHAADGSLPLPKLSALPLPLTLPPSLPARPGPPPPVFVKREAATLPQSMSLPAVAPMGAAWEGEDNISGNEKRRRASQAGLSFGEASPSGNAVPLSGKPIGGLMRIGSSISLAPAVAGVPSSDQSCGEKRPERLVRLGQSLRQSIAAKGHAVTHKA